MRETRMTARIGRRGADLTRIADRVVARPELVSELLEGLSSSTPRIKYGCSKVLRFVSERKPAVLYPDFAFFAGMLDCDNSFLKWDAIRIVGNLAAADREGKVGKILDRYLRPISGPVMITAATVIQSAARIALGRPKLASRIARAVLEVERAQYRSAECRNVAIGHAIESLGRFFHQLEAREATAVVEFVRRQQINRRNAVRRKAALFLKQHSLEPLRNRPEPLTKTRASANPINLNQLATP